ncbi:MAG: DUF6529 family protein [Actinomycetota bacterium]
MSSNPATPAEATGPVIGGEPFREAGASTSTSALTPLLAAVVLGAAISLSLGVYGRVHTPTGGSITTFGFPAVLPMKAWFTTVAAALGIGQAVSAAWLWGRLPGVGPAPSSLGTWHRWLGTVAFFFTLPVAYHCLWALGFQQTTTRVLLHSLFGCAFYGALAAKLLLLRSPHLPGWTLPAAGGLLVAVLTGIWFTSSLWFFTNVGFPGV